MVEKEVLAGKVKTLAGKEVDLADYKGKVVLIVNVASECGYTRQYKGLEDVYNKNKDKGFVILGFPCNQFGGQEPGTAEEIQEFCSSKFNVTFPLFEKIDVNGAKQSAVYKKLTSKEGGSETAGAIKWNFEKFLISRTGKIVKRFPSKVAPESPEFTKAINTELDKKVASS